MATTANTEETPWGTEGHRGMITGERRDDGVGDCLAAAVGRTRRHDGGVDDDADEGKEDISEQGGGRKKKEVLATTEDSQVTATATASDVYGSNSEQQPRLARAAEDGKPRRRSTDRGKRRQRTGNSMTTMTPTSRGKQGGEGGVGELTSGW
ncbi:hypothetical protein E2562_014780 [Oryza meyeriana var. granulata]|uniref:DUF834 domain-containing protein n=1 Tax=Oryza meyeriana var. granulata TaxID=110450 RepID=A0A6G1BW85_9ORYZ|nr:hypothetical protein E2562_014780 [Oryza meyeriana var. granulata]